jgi:hypothetical protein
LWAVVGQELPGERGRASTEDRLAGVEVRAMRKIFGSYRVAMETVIIVAALVLIRWALW